MNRTEGAIGVWLVGACGAVATTAVAGASALCSGSADPTGCVTLGAGFPGEHLPPLGDLVFGGHELPGPTLVDRVRELAGGRVLPDHLLEPCEKDLIAADQEVREGYPGPTGGNRFAAGAVQAEVAGELAADIDDFRRRLGLSRVVVVNVASTEPPVPPRPEHGDVEALERALPSAPDLLPPSSLYAYAALTAGCPYIDFTPSPGMRLPALTALADRRGVPYAGSDAKTGETLLQAAIAPMFAARGLRVRAWSGTNLLGGGDGATLADPGPAASKARSKRRTVQRVLGDGVEGAVRIDNVPTLGAWKTAWDHVAFDGFLGVPMTLQFTWQGCDSALAAPLVLDLVRLTAAAQAAGASGPLEELAFFFKDPVGRAPADLASQWRDLCAFAASLRAR